MQHRELVFAMEGPFPPFLARRANTIKPPVLYSVLTVLAGYKKPKRLTNFPGFCAATQCLLGVLNHA